MMMRKLGFMRGLDIVVTVLLVIGGLNWGILGIFGFNVIGTVFTAVPVISRIIYAVVGLSALYEIFGFNAMQRRWECTWTTGMQHQHTAA